MQITYVYLYDVNILQCYNTMLTSFPIAISVIEEVDGVYIYKYINNVFSTLFKVDTDKCIDTPIRITYSGVYNEESTLYSLVNVFFKSHEKELHSVIPIQYLKSLDDSCKSLGIIDAYVNGVLQMYIIATLTNNNRAVFFASVQPFITPGTDTTNTDYIVLINKLDDELQRINKTVYYGNGTPSLLSRFSSIETSILNNSNNITNLEDKLQYIEDNKIQQLEENTYWVSVISKTIKGKWFIISVLIIMTFLFSIDLDKKIMRKIIRPIMDTIVKTSE
jgi:hypothetical protein